MEQKYISLYRKYRPQTFEEVRPTICNKNIEKYASGILYLKGKRIDIEQYLEGNIVYIENEEKKPNIKYIDLKAFDDLI